MLRVLPRVCGLWLAISAVAVAGTFHLGAHNFTLPDGFEIELVAGPPLVDRPVSATFDEEGRLYVTESAGSSAKAPEQAKDQPNRVVRFEAADGAGHFGKRTVFADHLPLVEGVMWLNGSLYVGAPPSIWKLTDTDGDGVADQRIEWYRGQTVTGCGNDIHGPFLGPEGWIYWCKGAFAEQTHEVQGGRTIKDRASHIFRCRPDGTGLESIMTGGMDNPVGLAFTREGEPIFSATFLDLSGNGKRDGLGHAVYGGVFGKENAVVEDRAVIRTGPLLPAMTHYGAGAPCGMTRIQSGVLGEEYRDNLLVCLFNLHKVTRHVLEPSGATYKTRDSDFVVSDSLDFHPTDVVEDADGSLLIVDTGGWYKMCCPTSQLAKPDVLGAIYRVRKTGAAKIEDPRGLKQDWAKLDASALAAMLSDQRSAVVARATARLAEIGESVIPALQAQMRKGRPTERQTIIWALSQIPGKPARSAIGSIFEDKEAEVRQTAVKIAGLSKDHVALSRQYDVSNLLDDPSPSVRRVAIEALGRIGERSVIPSLVKAAHSPSMDRALEHALTFALIEIGDSGAIAQSIPTHWIQWIDENETAKRIALTAICEMGSSTLAMSELFRDLVCSDAELRRLATWIISRHPETNKWFTAAMDEVLLATRENDGLRDAESLFAMMLREPAGQQKATEFLRGELVTGTVESRHYDAEALVTLRRSTLNAIRSAALKTPPREWIDECARLLGVEKALLPLVISTAKVLAGQPEGTRLSALLRALAHSAETAELRLAALDALPGNLIDIDELDFAGLHEILTDSSSSSSAKRLTVLGVLARAKLGDSQKSSLVELLPRLGPLELTRLLPVFNRALPEPLAAQFLAALEKSPGLASCPPQTLREIFAKQPAALQPRCQALLARLNMDTAQQRAKLDAIAAELPPGEMRRGQLIFNGKAACTVCHSFGYLGGKFGPDLTSIGAVRSERDLLEAIVFPSASFVRSFEPMTVKLKNGTELMGLLRSENDEAVVLATAPGVEQRLARGEVATVAPGSTSLMPQGFDQILTRQELSDLIAFLKASQPKPH